MIELPEVLDLPLPPQDSPALDEYVQLLFARSVPSIAPDLPSTYSSPYCWIWCGATTRDGYAKHRVPAALKEFSKTTYISRFIYEVYNTPAGDLTVDHACSVKACINMYHLRLLPRKMNADMGDHRKIWET